VTKSFGFGRWLFAGRLGLRQLRIHQHGPSSGVWRTRSHFGSGRLRFWQRGGGAAIWWGCSCLWGIRLWWWRERLRGGRQRRGRERIGRWRWRRWRACTKDGQGAAFALAEEKVKWCGLPRPPLDQRASLTCHALRQRSSASPVQVRRNGRGGGRKRRRKNVQSFKNPQQSLADLRLRCIHLDPFIHLQRGVCW
jgi:hypothetical protein